MWPIVAILFTLLILSIGVFFRFFCVKKEQPNQPSQAQATYITDSADNDTVAAPVSMTHKTTVAQNHDQAEEEAQESVTNNADYDAHYKVLSSEHQQAQAFKLFATEAAFFWNKGDSHVTLLSITTFLKGAPKTEEYSTYVFNIKNWSWEAEQPKGCAAEVKKHLSLYFTRGETA